ncbi:SH2 domain-containing protein 2A isoform X2 [Dendrobates tinctorius]|uniref:SH2 domain-containing protein 2A isoform X2 n=1 Tax=Dendrobates tinctorius TaxID=92724 RepID=UPI003CCA3832
MTSLHRAPAVCLAEGAAPDTEAGISVGARRRDFPPIFFSTFKPIPENKDMANSRPACREKASLLTESVAEAKNKNIDSSPTISVSKEPSKKPKATLKDQTYQWFERTQRKKLLKSGQFADWFHGFITRRRAEEILQDKPLGCFLIRFCESRIGFVLSYRGAERCRHFKLNQLEDERYVIEGEETFHPSLDCLINYYCKFPVEPYKEMLTTACPTNSFRDNVSGSSQLNPQDGQMYSRISKQNSDPATPLPTSSIERNRVICEEKTPVEYASPSAVRKVPALLRKGPVQSPQNRDLSFAVTPVRQPSGDDESDVGGSCSLTPPYDPSGEVHTYTEPDFCDHPRVESGSNVSEPIAFYAVGRGSCKHNLENVYSEVDVNAITSCKPRAAVNRQAGLSTLPHTPTKPVKQKTTAFHSSFRSYKQSAAPQVDARSGHFSRTNMKPQLDDPIYARGQGLSDVDENIYEKIPENCVPTSKNPGRKAR